MCNYIIHYCEYWSDTMKYYTNLVNCLTWINIVKLSVAMVLFDLVSQVQRVASYKLLDNCALVQFPVMSLDAQFTPNYALLQNNELTCMDRIIISHWLVCLLIS